MPRRDPKPQARRPRKGRPSPEEKRPLRVVTPQPLLPDPDFNESKTEVEPLAETRMEQSATEPDRTGPAEGTNAKLLLIASVISLVVIALSLYALGHTIGPAAPSAPVVAPAEPRTVVKEIVREKEAPKADVMLNLDVQPKDANVSVRTTATGYRVRVSKPGYKPVVRTVARGVVEQISITLEKAPKKRRPKRVHRPRRSKKKRRGKRGAGDVFLTGGDL